MFTKTKRVEPVKILSLEDAKDQLNIIDFEDDDNYIRSLIKGATDVCEKTTNNFFSKTLVSCRFARLQTFLPHLPFIEVLTVKVDDIDVTYSVDDFSSVITITDPTVSNGDVITVTYHAGYTQKNIPELVKQACRIMVDDFYNNRGSMVDGKMVDVPLSAVTLLNTMRTNNIWLVQVD